LINTVNSITGVDLDTLEITPNIGGKGGHGGYAGPAVKPIALNMLSSLGADDIGIAALNALLECGGVVAFTPLGIGGRGRHEENEQSSKSR
jgi:dihydroorotate dehydrogenase